MLANSWSPYRHWVCNIINFWARFLTPWSRQNEKSMAQKRSADIYIQRDIAGTFHSNSPLTLHSSPIMTSSRMRKPYQSYDNSKNHNLTLQSKAMKNGENTHCAFHTCLFPTLWGRQISYFVSKFVAFYHPPRSTNLPHSSKSWKTHTHTHTHTHSHTYSTARSNTSCFDKASTLSQFFYGDRLPTSF